MGQTKNKEGNEISLTGELLETMKAQYEKRKIVVNGVDTICPFVFHRNGRPISLDSRDPWQQACISVGLGQMIKQQSHCTATCQVVQPTFAVIFFALLSRDGL